MGNRREDEQGKGRREGREEKGQITRGKTGRGSYSQFANIQFRTPADTPRSNQGSIISLDQKRAEVIF